MFINIALLLSGLILIIAGAEFLVRGATSVARKFGISEFVIGLTIVGIGTSAPEFVVSITGSLMGNSSISLGNVIGSNIFNMLIILGITALIIPIPFTKGNKKIDAPMNVIVSVVPFLMGMTYTLFKTGNDEISRTGGLVLILLFSGYMYLSFKKGKSDGGDNPSEKQLKISTASLLIAVGLAALIGGGQLFVNKAIVIAKILGVSDKFIAVTILAGGTSLPELAVCIVAALKKQDQLALGNILGSNIFNVLLILGVSSVISPISFSSMKMVDMAMILSASSLIMISPFLFKKNKITKIEGMLYISMYIFYVMILLQDK